MNAAQQPPRYVFVAGLHRTGTSLLARMIGSHPEVATITGSQAPEDEGCYLQGAIPHTAMHGRPGQYATDLAEHHIEGSEFDRLETQRRLISDWDRWFTPGGRWRLEKSPVNLTRMRLYQQLFPLAQFIVILRHPEAMAQALAKWSDRSQFELIDYGLDAYDLVARDLDYLHAACVIRYEDLVRAPDTMRAALFAFLDLDDHVSDDAIRNGNADYSYDGGLGGAHTDRMGAWGYLPEGRVAAFDPIVRHPLRAIRERVEAKLSEIPLLNTEIAKKNRKLTSVSRPDLRPAHNRRRWTP